MCRLAAYLGEEIPLNSLVFKPEHSIYVQSWQPKELNYAKLNADGFGFGWYLKDGTALSYRSHLPIWNDINLNSLATSLHSSLWLSMVRSATKNNMPSPLNVQPFKRGPYLFIHNGFINNFNEIALKKLATELPPAITKGIQGFTDSEYLFGLFCHLLNGNDEKSIKKALADTIHWCEQYLPDHAAMLNILIADGTSLYAVRHAINETPPSLYFVDKDCPGFPKHAHLIASEKFSEGDHWCEAPKASMLTVTKNKPIAVDSL